MLDVYASATHYLDHLAPVWFALPKTRRGKFYVTPDIEEYARTKALEVTTEAVGPGGPILVSASGNMTYVMKQGRERVSLMEHGAGQSYHGDRGPASHSSSYAGGDGRLAELFLHPGPDPASRDRARYPDARVEVVGCPKLDTLPAKDPSEPPTLAVSFHWDTAIAPETRSAFLYYRENLAIMAKLAREAGDFHVIGHGHPRIFDRLAGWYERKGIEAVSSFDEVCRRADVYAIDNSSTLFEFASTGRPVIVLNAPFYRRDMRHGLRFWDAANIGPQVDEPYDLLEVARQVFRRDPAHDPWHDSREAALDLVYGYRKGAAKRAAKVLAEWSR